ncbi:NAD(P)H-dependent glycerol-3-phosphate dehydrogenase [Fictibacillus phosphorivorans]|uniref:Glycerol-3-phosphate dehydrogenase [NAD(P)+] n=1 Tax=Fictibacillus phosphorivorans TaxID=1221500 RepID=A0A168W395_9BACL|nr:NAD(P)H-dependent glycerol-3-phosphate dehydrogenase [Fictibacillus phosphorivorans]ANC77695.1 glycerol-3-phosphate dehydrogenase [Fictibacillus phosphorivorans]MQR95767.1 NAD(P)H-dependent glycerol-3-phosphate dehydrogenase [Fictibacillus phosphorivorans]
MDKVAVLGAGSWGTALAIVLADNGHHVSLWGRREDQVSEINNHHTNEKYLPGVELPENIQATTQLSECVKEADTIVLVTPTKAMREVLGQVKNELNAPVTIVHASKGIEPGTYKRISEIIEEELPASVLDSVVVLSGPSHAEEVSLRQPTTVTVSSVNMEAAENVQDLFINQNFRVYTNPDVVGVELGGALKNIIALGAGLSDGLGYGDNAKAALITRGLAEIARLGTHMGANPLTFSGLTGIGDLIVTCTSVHSRNWRAGNMLGKGMKLEDVLENMGMVVEGVRTTQAAYELSKREEVEMPITQVLYDVLFNGKGAKQAVDDLMQRSRTHEVEDVSSLKS